MLQGILILLGGVVAASGWFFAWRSRGETNKAGDRARIAEARADAERARALDSDSGRAAAEAQVKAAAAENKNLRAELALERKTKGDLLEKLAKADAPVGDVLLDSTVDRLYANRHREGNGPGSRGGGGEAAVPGDPTKPPTGSDPRG